MYDVPTDVADLMAPNPAIQITTVPSISFTYLMLDAADRTGVGHFKDVRVREAMMRAIDRKALVNALQPKEIAAMPLQKSMCHEWHVGCAASTSPPDFDLAKAKQLMAEAGKEKGFDLTITTWGAARPVAEAVAGQLRRIGVNAKIENLTVGGFVTKRAAGQLPAYIVLWDNGGANPDVESTSGFFYEPGSRNYNNDAELADLDEKAKSEMDPKKREAMYQRIFDKVNEQRYSMPITPLGSVLAHSKEVRIPKAGTKKPEGFMFNLLAWN
jgi:peptide/nickel transport system substrate-binding protein